MMDFTEEKNDLCGLFDSHAHYFDSRFDGEAETILTELFEA